MAEERPLRSTDERAGHDRPPFVHAHRTPLGIVAAAIAVVVVLLLSPTISGTLSGPSPGDTGSASPGSTLPYPIKHVFVIVLENVAFSKALTLPAMDKLPSSRPPPERVHRKASLGRGSGGDRCRPRQASRRTKGTTLK